METKKKHSNFKKESFKEAFEDDKNDDLNDSDNLSDMDINELKEMQIKSEEGYKHTPSCKNNVTNDVTEKSFSTTCKEKNSLKFEDEDCINKNNSQFIDNDDDDKAFVIRSTASLVDFDDQMLNNIIVDMDEEEDKNKMEIDEAQFVSDVFKSENISPEVSRKFSKAKVDSVSSKYRSTNNIVRSINKTKNIFQLEDDVVKIEEEIRLDLNKDSEYVLDPSEQFYIKKDELKKIRESRDDLFDCQANRFHSTNLPVNKFLTNSSLNIESTSKEVSKVENEVENQEKDEKIDSDEEFERTRRRFESGKSVKFSVKKVVFEYPEEAECKGQTKFYQSSKVFPNSTLKEKENNNSDSDSDGDGLTEKERQRLEETRKRREEQALAKKVEEEEKLRKKLELQKLEESSSKNSKNSSKHSKGSSKKGKKKK